MMITLREAACLTLPESDKHAIQVTTVFQLDVTRMKAQLGPDSDSYESIPES